MNEQQLRTFLAIIEFGSFGKAEKRLNISRPGIKKQIDILEDELGFRLINRNQNGVSLTPAGKEFHAGVKEVLALLDKTIEASKNIAIGCSVRIQIPNRPQQLLENVFIEFRNKYPDIYLHLNMYSNDMEFYNDLTLGKCDIIECTYRDEYIHPGICYKPLVSQSYHCLLSPLHPLANRKNLYLQDLAGFSVVIGGKPPAKLIEEIYSCCTESAVRLMPQTNVSSIYNLCYNDGIFITKADFKDSIQPFSAIPLNTEYSFTTGLLYLEHPVPAVKKFLSVTEKHFPQTAEAL